MAAQQGRTRRRNRSIDRILARRRARRRRRSHTHAPDELHGDCRVDAVYRTFGERWAEETAFAASIAGKVGAHLGWTVARFDDRFLEIGQGVQGEVADADAWLAERVDGVERVVVLEIPRDNHGRVDLATPEVVPIRATRSRFLELERRRLSAARDREFGRAQNPEALLEEQLLQSRVDVLSLICLCARLA